VIWHDAVAGGDHVDIFKRGLTPLDKVKNGRSLRDLPMLRFFSNASGYQNPRLLPAGNGSTIKLLGYDRVHF